jgi:hypothetical protein
MISVTGGATYFTDLRPESINSGTVDAVAALVPEPTSLALLGGALLAMGPELVWAF